MTLCLALAPATGSYDWLVGTWTCQIDSEKWAKMSGTGNSSVGVTLSWSWDEYGSGAETIRVAANGKVTLDGRSTDAYYKRTWNLTRISGNSADSTFEGAATEDGHGKHRSYRLRNEVIRTGSDELAEWRQVFSDADWHATSSRHCALGRTPQGTVY
jgi:hypothetical protein